MGGEIRKGDNDPSVEETGLYKTVFEFDVGVLRAEELVVIFELEICLKNHFLKS